MWTSISISKEFRTWFLACQLFKHLNSFEYLKQVALQTPSSIYTLHVFPSGPHKYRVLIPSSGPQTICSPPITHPCSDLTNNAEPLCKLTFLQYWVFCWILPRAYKYCRCERNSKNIFKWSCPGLTSLDCLLCSQRERQTETDRQTGNYCLEVCNSYVGLPCVPTMLKLSTLMFLLTSHIKGLLFVWRVTLFSQLIFLWIGVLY